MALPSDTLIDLVRSVHSETPGTDYLRTSGGGGGGGGVTTPAGFGNLSPGYPTQIAVGSISTEVLPANSNRQYAHFINNTQYPMFLQFTGSAALNQGIPLGPKTFYALDSANLYKGAINAICVITGQLVDVCEGTP